MTTGPAPKTMVYRTMQRPDFGRDGDTWILPYRGVPGEPGYAEDVMHVWRDGDWREIGADPARTEHLGRHGTAAVAAPRKRRHRWPWIVIGAGVLLLIIIVVAASSGASRPGTATSAGTATQTQSVAPPAAPKPSTTPFGQNHVYDNGLLVGVAAPYPFQPADTAAGYTAGQRAVAMDITVTNNSSQNYDPRLLMVSAQSGATEGSQIFDSANNISGPPETVVLPGRSVTFPVAFAVANTDDVVVQVTPGFQYSAGVFTR